MRRGRLPLSLFTTKRHRHPPAGVRFSSELSCLALAFAHTANAVYELRDVGWQSFAHYLNLLDAMRQLCFYACVVVYVVLLCHPLRLTPKELPADRFVNYPEAHASQKRLILA